MIKWLVGLYITFVFVISALMTEGIIVITLLLLTMLKGFECIDRILKKGE